MSAQRLSSLTEEYNDIIIDAVDIDKVSAEEAGANFVKSPWKEMLHAYNAALDEFSDASHLSQHTISSLSSSTHNVQLLVLFSVVDIL